MRSSYGFLPLSTLILSATASPLHRRQYGGGGGGGVSQQDQSTILQKHNQLRQKYGEQGLSWSSSLAGDAQQYANSCPGLNHSPGAQSGQYGENLAGPGQASVSQLVDLWSAEESKYDWNNPGFSMATGHFTAMIWKSTTEVGCGLGNCQGGSFLVCRYNPPGNDLNKFATEVPRAGGGSGGGSGGNNYGGGDNTGGSNGGGNVGNGGGSQGGYPPTGGDSGNGFPTGGGDTGFPNTGGNTGGNTGYPNGGGNTGNLPWDNGDDGGSVQGYPPWDMSGGESNGGNTNGGPWTVTGGDQNGGPWTVSGGDNNGIPMPPTGEGNDGSGWINMGDGEGDGYSTGDGNTIYQGESPYGSGGEDDNSMYLNSPFR